MRDPFDEVWAPPLGEEREVGGLFLALRRRPSPRRLEVLRPQKPRARASQILLPHHIFVRLIFQV